MNGASPYENGVDAVTQVVLLQIHVQSLVIAECTKLTLVSGNGAIVTTWQS